MQALTGKRYLLLWLLIPLLAVVLYPFTDSLPQGQKILTAALSMSVMFFSILIHEVSHGVASSLGGDNTANDDGTPRIIYGRNNAYNSTNGTIEFTYPDNLVFERLLDSLLLLANKPNVDFESFRTAMSRKSWRFIDPLTGEVKFAFKDSTLRSLIPIGENNRTMFFAARPVMKAGNLSATAGLFNIFFPSKGTKEGQKEFLVKLTKLITLRKRSLQGH